jgi:hypothetical protein
MAFTAITLHNISKEESGHGESQQIKCPRNRIKSRSMIPGSQMKEVCTRV